MSNFLIIFLQFVKRSQFVKNVFKKAQKEHVVLSYFVLKTGFLTNLDCMQIFTIYSFQKCKERRRPLLIDDVIITRLFWKFWIFSNQLGQNIIRKCTPDYFLARKIPKYCVKHIYILWTNQCRISHLGIFLPFLSKVGPKNQNCLFKMKFGKYTNSNMLNSIMMFLFLCFLTEVPFLDKFGPKNWIVCLSFNLASLTWIYWVRWW